MPSEPTTTVTFLGTSSVTPEAGHDTASIMIDRTILVDTGWYGAIRMLQYGFNPMDVQHLFITHCHHDHYIGLPHLLFYLRMRRSERPDRPPLTVVGPAQDIQRVVDLARAFLQTDRFPAVECIPSVVPVEPGETVETPSYQVTASPSLHPVQGLVYRFTHKLTGKSLALSGDTAPHPPIIEHVRGVDLLIHEASFGSDTAPAENSALHSGAPDAARVAQAAGVKQLALVHCAAARQADALTAARRIFPNSVWPRDGEQVVL